MTTPLTPSELDRFHTVATQIDALPSPARETTIGKFFAFVSLMSQLNALLEPDDCTAVLAFMDGQPKETWPEIVQAAITYETARRAHAAQ